MKSVMFVVSSMWIGGIQRVNAVLANELGKNNRVCLYSTMSKEESLYPLTVEHFKTDKDDPWSIKSIKLRIYGMLGLKFLVKKILINDSQRLIQIIKDWKPETVVLNAEHILYLPYLKEIFPEKKFIAWIHGSWNVYLNRVFFGIRTFLAKGLSMADVVLCLTSEDACVFSAYNKNTKVIYNPLTIENQTLANLDDKVISWTGNLRHPVKGIDYLAEIAGKLPEDWKIAVAGGGDMKRLNRFIQKNHAEQKVIVQGELSGDELHLHYLNSSLYLMTSRWEGFGLVLSEAMSYGLPILAFSQIGSREVLLEGKYGVLVENGNVDAMVEEINRFIDSEELRKEYREKSLKRIGDFSLDKISSKWKKLI